MKINYLKIIKDKKQQEERKHQAKLIMAGSRFKS
tara:strand:+ start:7866 stop:7967 length:102 start_codon:yes stop_codon:yes gene_type:complete